MIRSGAKEVIPKVLQNGMKSLKMFRIKSEKPSLGNDGFSGFFRVQIAVRTQRAFTRRCLSEALYNGKL